MLKLKRHQHIFTTLAGETVTSTLIPHEEGLRECITLISLRFLIGVPPIAVREMLHKDGFELVSRNGQDWAAVEDLMTMFDLRSRV